MEVEINKLGLSLGDYKCSKCGNVHYTSFVLSRLVRKCGKCGNQIGQIRKLKEM